MKHLKWAEHSELTETFISVIWRKLNNKILPLEQLRCPEMQASWGSGEVRRVAFTNRGMFLTSPLCSVPRTRGRRVGATGCCKSAGAARSLCRRSCCTVPMTTTASSPRFYGDRSRESSLFCCISVCLSALRKLLFLGKCEKRKRKHARLICQSAFFPGRQLS